MGGAGAREEPAHRRVADLVRKRSDEAPTFVDQRRRDERREKHALRPDERPDRDLAVIETGARGWVRVTGYCCGHNREKSWSGLKILDPGS